VQSLVSVSGSQLHLASGQWRYLYIDVDDFVESITITAQRISSVGDPDFYINAPDSGSSPTVHEHDFADITCDTCGITTHTMELPDALLRPGRYVIAAFAFCCDDVDFSMHADVVYQVNACAVDHGGCDALANCTQIDGGHLCGGCPPGYTGPSYTPNSCKDINECRTANGGCDGLTNCVNTIGSRTCGNCPTGYTGDGSTGCVEVNECQTNRGGCDPLTNCTNLPGHRICGACPPFYTGDGHVACLDVDECQTSNGGCAFKCTNQIGAAPICSGGPAREDINNAALGGMVVGFLVGGGVVALMAFCCVRRGYCPCCVNKAMLLTQAPVATPEMYKSQMAAPDDPAAARAAEWKADHSKQEQTSIAVPLDEINSILKDDDGEDAHAEEARARSSVSDVAELELQPTTSTSKSSLSSQTQTHNSKNHNGRGGGRGGGEGHARQSHQPASTEDDGDT